MKSFVLLLSSFVVGTVFYNCSTTDGDPVRISGQWKFSTVAIKDSGDVVDIDADVGTRGLFIGGATGKRYVSLWDQYDTVRVYKSGGKTADDFLGKLLPASLEGYPIVEVTGSLSGDVSEGDALDFYVPKVDRDYRGQTGALTDMTKFAYMSSQLRINNIDAEEKTVSTDPIEFAGKECYLRLRFTDYDGELRLPVEQLIIHSLSGQILLRKPLVPTVDDPILHGDLVINTVYENGCYPIEVYVCMHNDLGTTDGYVFTIKSGGYYYVTPDTLNYNFRDTKYVIARRTVKLQGPATRVTTTTTIDGFEDGGGDSGGRISY